MEVGAVDARGRAYDASFASLRRRLFGPGAELLLGEGEVTLGSGALKATLDLVVGHRPQPVLLATPGEALVTTERLVFVAAEELDREAAPSRLNVEVAAMPRAVEHFFRQGGGREFLEVPLREIQEVTRERTHVAVKIRAVWPGPDLHDLVLHLAPAAEAGGLLAAVRGALSRPP